MGLLASWISRPIELVRRAFRARGTRRRRSAAQALVAAGELERAAAEYAALGEPGEASRLLALQAELTTDPSQRLELLTRALLQPGAAAPELVLRRARLCIDLVRSGRLELPPSELGEVARSLIALEQPVLAAEVYALAGDSDAQAEQLVAAGEVEALQTLLERTDRTRAAVRRAREGLTAARDLHRLGARREALRRLRRLCEAGAGIAEPELESARELAGEIEGTRASGSRSVIELDGSERELVFGRRITVGRAGDVSIPAPSLSREHLAIERTPRGVCVRELGSRNGTFLRGQRLAGELALVDALELRLAGDVALSLQAEQDGVWLRWAEQRVFAPLGPLRLGELVLEPAQDAWLELAHVGGQPLVLSGLKVAGPIQLCRGDVVAEALDAPARIKVLS